MKQNKIKSQSQFFYVDRDQDRETMKGIIESMTHGVVSCYLRRMAVIKKERGWIIKNQQIDTDDNIRSTIVDDTDFIIREVPSMLEKYPDIMTGFKIVEPGGIIYMGFGFAQGDVLISYMEFSPNNKGLYLRGYAITNDNGEIKIGEVGGTPYITARKTRDAENYCKTIAMTLKADLLINVHQMRCCLEEYKTRCEADTLEYPLPDHHKAEISIIRRLLLQTGTPVCIPVNILGLIRTDENMEDDSVIQQEEGGIKTHPLREYWDMDTTQSPIVDLSKREWKFISKHMSGVKCFGVDGNKIPLRKMLSSSRIGNNFRIPIEFDDGSITEAWVHIKLLPDDRIRWIIRCDIEDRFSVFCEMAMGNSSSCMPLEEVDKIRTDVIIRGAENLVTSEQGVLDITPVSFQGYRDVLVLLARLISLYVVSYDKPERLRMVTETMRVRQNDGIKKPGNEKPYVVKRILPAGTAKKYVKEKMGEAGRMFEYTLENWSRSGHYRTYKSGKQVWIGETECQRKLPLTDKDIHIKL